MVSARHYHETLRSSKASLCVLCRFPPPPSASTPWGIVAQHRTTLQTMAAPAEPKVSLIGCLPALTARLDDLRADQDPADLSKALISAFTEREGYKMHLAFLAEDETRSKALLEVFDKVFSDRMCNFVKYFSALPCRAGPCGPGP